MLVMEVNHRSVAAPGLLHSLSDGVRGVAGRLQRLRQERDVQVESRGLGWPQDSVLGNQSDPHHMTPIQCTSSH